LAKGSPGDSRKKDAKVIVNDLKPEGGERVAKAYRIGWLVRRRSYKAMSQRRRTGTDCSRRRLTLIVRSDIVINNAGDDTPATSLS
jgi:hypothetical protein